MADFLLGFELTGRVLLRIAGGCAAALLLALTVFIVLVLSAAAFDWITNSLARRWEQKGHNPRNKLERIIQESFRRKGK